MFNAVKSGSLANVIELIENGAKVNFISEKTKKTPLFRARSYEIVKYLIQKGAKAIVIDEKTNEKINAIEHLMEYNPEAARAIFDDCLDIDKEENLIMDFKLFDGLGGNDGIDESEEEMILLEKAENQFRLLSIEDNNLKKRIILHPLLQIFLHFKFKTIRLHFWLLLAFQFIMVVTLTTIGVGFVQFTACANVNATNPQDEIAHFKNRYISGIIKDETRASWDLLTCDKNITHIAPNQNGCALEELCKIYYEDPNKTIGSCWTYHWFTIVAWVVLGIHFLKECFEIASKESVFNYIFNLENLLELFVFICAIFFMVISHYDIEMAYHASAWMVFFVWIDLVLYLGRISLIGKYIFMSLHVMRVLFLCLMAYLPIFFGFTFGYYILLQANETFNGYVRGFISVLAMMIDEIGYGQFDYKKVTMEGGLNWSTQVMTIFFMVFVSLILMNLLIAVTVSNTDMLKNQSQIHISHRKISHINEVMKFREWPMFKICKYIPYLKKIGIPVLEGTNKFRMVSSNFIVHVLT